METLTLTTNGNTTFDTLNQSGGTANCYIPNYWQPYITQFYPAYGYIYQQSGTDKAFKVVQILIEKKILDEKKLTVAKFIELVGELAKEL